LIFSYLPMISAHPTFTIILWFRRLDTIDWSAIWQRRNAFCAGRTGTRFRQDADLNKPDPKTFYRRGTKTAGAALTIGEIE